jgi:uncharacterized protein
MVKRHPVASFFVLAYVITWLAWLPAMLGYQGDLFQVLWTIAQFGPALAGFVVCWYSGVSVRSWALGIIRWRVSPWWYVFAVGVPVPVYGVQDAVFGLLGNPVNLSLGPDQCSPSSLRWCS